MASAALRGIGSSSLAVFRILFAGSRPTQPVLSAGMGAVGVLGLLIALGVETRLSAGLLAFVFAYRYGQFTSVPAWFLLVLRTQMETVDVRRVSPSCRATGPSAGRCASASPAR